MTSISKKSNNEILDLYSSHYKINNNDELVYFDREQEKKISTECLIYLGNI